MNQSSARHGVLVLKLLGRPQLLAADGSAIVLPGRKPLALLAYVSHSPGMQAPRSMIADMLWGNRDDEHARNNLRQTLSVLRKSLSLEVSDLLVSDGDNLSIAAGMIQCDTCRLESLSPRSPADLREAARLYDGPFLDGFSAGSEGFDEWANRERDRLAQFASAIFEKLARSASGVDGIDYARRLLAIDPFREASHRVLMEQLAAAGEHDMALKQYDICRRLLERELGVPPDRETEQLRENLLQSRKSRSFKSVRLSSLADRAKDAAEARVFLGVQRFMNLGGGDAAGLFAMGLEQNLIAELSEDHQITVRADRNGEGHGADSRGAEQGNRYGIKFLLGGSIQPHKEGLRVNARLIETVTGDHVWAERYEGDGTPDFQSQISGLIVSAVRLGLLLGKFNLRDRAPPDSTAVRQIVNQAIFCFFQQTKESVSKAIALAEQALSIDPVSVRGRRTLTAAISAAITLGVLPRTQANLDRALAIAQDVVLIAPYDEIARCELAWALTNAERHAEAADELRHAINLNPSSPNARADLAEQLAILGQGAAALQEVQQAFALSGYDPLEIWRHCATAMAHFTLGEYGEALEISRHMARAEPAFVRGVVYWAAAAAAVGLEEEAGRAVTQLTTLVPEIRLETLAPTYVPRFVQPDHQQRLLAMMQRAGLPGMLHEEQPN